MKAFSISSEYPKAIRDALAFQVLVLFLSAFLLDGGRIFQICLMGALAYWGCVVTLALRYPQSPSKVDLASIRIGYPLVVVMTFLLANWIWILRGV